MMMLFLRENQKSLFKMLDHAFLKQGQFYDVVNLCPIHWTTA